MYSARMMTYRWICIFLLLCTLVFASGCASLGGGSADSDMAFRGPAVPM